METEKFRRKMRPFAVVRLAELFEGCLVMPVNRGEGIEQLDRERGIDTVIRRADGEEMTFQEKYRRHDVLIDRKRRVWPKCPDFTIEYMNAARTPRENPGEWFHLDAQYYFYAWANDRENGFAAGLVLNIPKFKERVRDEGGLEAIGKLRFNEKHGAASFYAIPVLRLLPAFVRSFGLFEARFGAVHENWKPLIRKVHRYLF